MGLDMYLKAQKYVGGWRHNRESKDQTVQKEVKAFDAIVKATGMKPSEGSPSFDVSATIGYWRKANAIHAWFVKNCQDGKDDCGAYEVSREQLEELREDCRKVIDSVEMVDGKLKNGTTYHGDGRVEHHTVDGKIVAQKNVAAKVLPTQSGFFFGGTDYDEYYIQDLKDTIKIIDNALTNPAYEGCDFYYHSSW